MIKIIKKVGSPIGKFIVKVIIALVGILVIVMLIDFVQGGVKLYNYNHNYSLEQQAKYFVDTENILDGIPNSNLKILKQENVKFERRGRGAWDEPFLSLEIPTRHFIFTVSNDNGIDGVYNRKTGKQIILSKEKKSKELQNLMKKELSEKMKKIGCKMNYQMAHFNRD